MGVDGGGCLTELSIDPILEDAKQGKNLKTDVIFGVNSLNHNYEQYSSRHTLMDTLCLVKARLRSSW